MIFLDKNQNNNKKLSSSGKYTPLYLNIKIFRDVNVMISSIFGVFYDSVHHQ